MICVLFFFFYVCVRLDNIATETIEHITNVDDRIGRGCLRVCVYFSFCCQNVTKSL